MATSFLCFFTYNMNISAAGFVALVAKAFTKIGLKISISAIQSRNSVRAIDVRERDIQIDEGFKLSTLLKAKTNKFPTTILRSKIFLNSGLLTNAKGFTRICENFTIETLSNEIVEHSVAQANAINRLGA
jgi:hypothetical protein